VVEIPVTKTVPDRSHAAAVGWVKNEGLG
jgi:hypothetical protein